MAQIVLSNDELVKLISGFVLKNQRISEVIAEDSKIKFKIKTPGILPSVTVSIEFREFSRGLAYFNLEANPLVKLIIEYFDVPGTDWLKIESSQIAVNINRMLRARASNLSVNDIRQPASGQFLVEVEIG